MTLIRYTPLAAAAALLSACGTVPTTMFSQDSLPTAVQVPAGHRVSMETVGVGEITYECRAKATLADQHEWVFIGPKAVLRDRAGRTVGSYYGPPATWESSDGSRLTGAQVAVAAAMPGSLPRQLVKANPATGSGAMAGVSHIQRVATQGGVAPALACNAAALGRKEIVRYQADYIFWKPA